MPQLIKHWPTPLVSGLLLVTTWALTLTASLHWLDTTVVATVLAWLYVAFELPRLSRKQKIPILVLLFGGIGFAIATWIETGQVDVIALGSEHLKLVMLLAAINFIRLATKLHKGSSIKGLPSFFATMTGMHVFSSVANFSSLMMVGDQIRRPPNVSPGLSPLSYILLSRAFAMAVFWSPFLAMIPLLLQQLPSVEMNKVYPWSLTMVAFGFLFTLAEAKLRFTSEAANYQGYPMRVSSLRLPVLLIASLLLTHFLLPGLPMLVVVSILAVAIPLALMLISHTPRQSVDKLVTQLRVVLPGARPEISLFLIAGFLAASVKSAIAAGLIVSPFHETNALVASIVMVLLFVIASLGIHQFALLAIFAGLLNHVTSTPTLMAVAYMVGVSLSMSSSVFSGVNFILHGQFQVRNRDMYRHNLPYSIAMLAFGSVVLFVMEANGIQ